MQMEENQKNVCFICSMERPVFDKTQVHGLEIHMQLDHNQWNYLFYIYYLKKKQKTEYNGIESYVYDCYLNEDINWFPLGKALYVEDSSTNVELEIESKLSNLYEELRKYNEEYEKIKSL